MTFFHLLSLHCSPCYCIHISSEHPPQRKHVRHSHALGALSFDIQIYANPAAVEIKCSSQTPVVMGANVIGQDTKWFRHNGGCDVLGCCFDPHGWTGECIWFCFFFCFFCPGRSDTARSVDHSAETHTQNVPGWIVKLFFPDSGIVYPSALLPVAKCFLL